MLLLACPAYAQHEHEEAADAEGWTATVHATVFANANLQVRRFRDFYQFESQNWAGGELSRPAAGGTLSLQGMLSLEPLTLRKLGSSQAFQTGETFGGAPLIDYQHPHDLVMQLAAGYARLLGRARLELRGGPVDAPALGPTSFMHRASARLHPTAPLAHHQLDATHIARSVLSAGLGAGAWALEASVFHGREPDEDRLDLDLGRPDSLAVRGNWRRRGTRVQVSAGWLHEPEAVEPGDVMRITASVEHEGAALGRPMNATLAWGVNCSRFADEHGLLAEASLGLSHAGTGYLRMELVDKHILEAGGLHPPGLEHPHHLSRVGAVTLGYSHDIRRGSLANLHHAFALGADVTGHFVPRELLGAYGRPVSLHVFGRWTVDEK